MELRWCQERGMPHSELLGWDPEDQAKLHAILLEEAGRCPMCGTTYHNDIAHHLESHTSADTPNTFRWICNLCSIHAITSASITGPPAGAALSLATHLLQHHRHLQHRQSPPRRGGLSDEGQTGLSDERCNWARHAG